MNLGYLTLRRLTEELGRAVVGKQVKAAAMRGEHDLILDFENAPGILLSASPVLGRICLSHQKANGDQDLPAWVTKFVVHGVIESVDQVPFERVIVLKFSKRDRLGGKSSCRLITEVMGRNSNVILVSEPDGRVEGALRRISERVNRKRQILPGKPYVGPPPLNRPLPEEVSVAQLETALQSNPSTPADALQKCVAGMDKLIAGDLLHQSGIIAGGAPSESSLSTLSRLLAEFFEAPAYLDRPSITRSGKRFSVCTVRLPNAAPDIIEQFDTVSEAIEELAVIEVREAGTGSRKGEIEKELRTVLEGIQRKMIRIESDIEDSQNADLYEKYGNILMANLHEIKSGMDTITLPDIYDADAPPVTIPLNLKRLPHENARTYLKRSTKARKGGPILENRLEKSRAEQKELESSLNQIDQVTQQDLEAFQDRLITKGYLRPRKKTPEAKRRKVAEGGIHPRRYRTSDGWSVLVGRNNTENDRLTAGAAREDIFLHAQGCPGSHVILKSAGNAGSPPKKSLEEAARLAAYWSKARNSRTVPVNYTEVRHVNKPRGAAPGLVRIRNEKTLFVNPGEISKEED